MDNYVPIPSFSSENLSIWFAQVESVFALNGITSDLDKYDYVVASIPTEYAAMLEDIILNSRPEPESKYNYLKYEFIKRMSIHHLKIVKLGKMKPSEYMKNLRKLADARVPKEAIYNIWLNNLPEKVREVLSLNASGNAENLANSCEIADKVMALSSIAVQDSQAGISTDYFKVILHRIDALSKQVQMLQRLFEDDDFEDRKEQPGSSACAVFRNPEELRTVSSNQQSSLRVTCWHHSVYGDMATNCAPRCQYYCNFLPK